MQGGIQNPNQSGDRPWFREQFAPAERRTLKFYAADVDDGGVVKYYGYVGTDTQYSIYYPWYIMQSQVVGGITQFRYFFGNSDYTNAWKVRTSLTYLMVSEYPGFHEHYDIR